MEDGEQNYNIQQLARNYEITVSQSVDTYKTRVWISKKR